MNQPKTSFLLSILCVASLIVLPSTHPACAVEPDKPVKHLFVAKLLLRRMANVNLTVKQKQAFDQLSRDLRARIDKMRDDVGITKEIIKRRDEVYSELKKTDLKEDELWNKLQEQAGITAAQRDVFRDTQEHYTKFRTAAIGLLTADQRASLPKGKGKNKPLATVSPKEDSEHAPATKPNVIVILADDVGYADVGFHDIVAPGVVTPNLNRLARSGAVFRNAYSASPVCSNSRLALFTGRYAQRWGAYYYGEGGLPTAEFTVAEMMRDAGYRTMKIGKTHLNKGPKEPPTKHGFDHSLGFIHHSWDFFLLSDKDVAAYEKKRKGSSLEPRQSPFGPLMRDDRVAESYENTTTTEVFGDESVKWIQQQSDKPFYLQLEFNAVHTPLIRAPKQLLDKYGIPERPFDRDAKTWEYPIWDPVAQPNYKEWYDQTCHLAKADPYGRKIYLAHLELMDIAIGKIMSALRQQGISQNTIVFFSSDNGGSNQSYANNGNINAYKYCLMNGGIKVPMIVSWPEKIAKNTSIDSLVTHRDLFATLSQVTGIAAKNPLDGKSLLPLVDQSQDTLHKEPLFWDCGTKNPTWITMQDDWKLVYRKEARSYLVYELDENGLVKPEFQSVPIHSGLQLYNLAKDGGEIVNLAEMHPERVRSMKDAHDRWRAKMIDPVSGRKAK